MKMNELFHKIIKYPIGGYVVGALLSTGLICYLYAYGSLLTENKELKHKVDVLKGLNSITDRQLTECEDEISELHITLQNERTWQ